MKCQACGHVVQRRAQFCPHCGQPVVPRTRGQSREFARPRWPLLLAMVAGGVLLGAVAVQLLNQRESPADDHVHFDGTLHGATLASQYPQVYQVAAEFICPCGTCTDGLEVCDCGMTRGSTEVRTKIYELLRVHHVPHVIELIEAEYGYRKSKSSSSLNLPGPSAPPPWAKPN